MLYFVYGTLKKGYINHRLLQNSHFVAEHKTEPNYTMYNLGAFPGVVDNGTTSITGELYEVNDKNVETRLDILEGYSPNSNHNLYDKKRIKTPYGEAYIYTFNVRNLRGTKEKIQSGIWPEKRG